MSTTHVSKTKLVSINIGGNLHEVAEYCRTCGFSDFFVQADYVGSGSVVLLRMPIDWPTDNFGPLKATPPPTTPIFPEGLPRAQVEGMDSTMQPLSPLPKKP